MSSIDQRARELLAAEHRKCERYTEADLIEAGDVTALGRMALNAIEAALRLSAGADWVSVEDRLPGPAEHVEVWPDPRDDTYSFYAHHNGGTNGIKAGRWYYNDRYGDDYEIRVTHWRPSPEPPAAPRHETGEVERG